MSFLSITELPFSDVAHGWGSTEETAACVLLREALTYPAVNLAGASSCPCVRTRGVKAWPSGLYITFLHISTIIFRLLLSSECTCYAYST